MNRKAARTAGVAVLAGLGLLAVGLGAGLYILLALIAVPTVAAGAYLIWRIEPAYTLCAAFFLSPFAGHWQDMHFPSGLDPDRILLCVGILQVLIRAPGIRDRPPFRFTAAHAFLALALVYAVISAYAAHTLFSKASFFKLLDTFGLLPFLTFLVAPIAFRTRRHRSALLVTLAAMGLYLSITTVAEVAHVNALVFPKYILDPNVGIHQDRGRGPFTDAVANGFAMFCCMVACGVARATWSQKRARNVATVVAALCLVGAFVSVQRSVWIGAAAGTLVMMITVSRLRRWLLPAALVTLALLVIALNTIPALSNLVSTRTREVSTVHDRQNLVVAGLNMVEAKPLTGFGWQTFRKASPPYFRQSQNYPLTAVGIDLHNVFLAYAVELGLVGFALWAAGLLLGVGGALLTRGPPDITPWRIGLVGVFVAFLVVANAVPPSLFTSLCPWLWAGVVSSGRYAVAMQPDATARARQLQARDRTAAIAW